MIEKQLCRTPARILSIPFIGFLNKVLVLVDTSGSIGLSIPFIGFIGMVIQLQKS